MSADIGGDGVKTVPVALGERSYDIKIGPHLIDKAGDLVAKYALGAPGAQCAIITDEVVARLYLDRLKQSLEHKNFLSGIVVLPAGEATKSFEQLIKASEQLLEMGLERRDFVVALGGGVIGDLAGFAASILRRGVRLVQIPTTLLAQVDSSVGGKTGINTSHGKNLVGTFHQPSLVIADTNVLETLSEREFRSGYAEVVKYGLLGDASFFAWLENNWQGVFRNEHAARMHAIEVSCQAKAAIVAEDERESGKRALLNLGHTFGHAIEAWAGYSRRVLHGEAIAIGMCLAFELSERMGICAEGRASRVQKHLSMVGLPTCINDIPGKDRPTADILWRHMAQDKKVKDGKPAFVLVRDIGEAFVNSDVSKEEVDAFLVTKCSDL